MTLILGALDAVEVAAIQVARKEMVRAALAADWDAFMQVYDEQTVLMPPNVAPLAGHEQLRSYIESFPTLSAFQITAEEIDRPAATSLSNGCFDMTGGGVPDSGSYLTIWKKQIDGSD